jgi:RNA recognition motif-containing protein
MKLFVGNLPFTITEDELRDAFVSVGDVASAKIVVDRMTGKSRGFGFVEMPNDEQARTAISQLHDRELKGRKLVVNEARPKDA